MQLACSREPARRIVRTAFERSEDVARYVVRADEIEGHTGTSLGNWGVTITAAINPVGVPPEEGTEADRHTVTVSASSDFGWDLGPDAETVRERLETELRSVYEEWQEEGGLPEPVPDSGESKEETGRSEKSQSDAEAESVDSSRETEILVDPRVRFLGLVAASFVVVWLIWSWIAAIGVLAGAVLVKLIAFVRSFDRVP